MLGNSLKTWPKPNDCWISWLDRVQGVHGHTWKELDIFEAIELSRYSFPVDRMLHFTVIGYWSLGSNIFFFGCGLVVITMMDIVSLTALSADALEVSALLDQELTFDVSSARLLWIIHIGQSWSRGYSRRPSRALCLLLLSWICQFLLSILSTQMTQEFGRLVSALVTGRRVALAPLVLSYIYRGLWNLLNHKLHHLGSPYWLIQT